MIVSATKYSNPVDNIKTGTAFKMVRDGKRFMSKMGKPIMDKPKGKSNNSSGEKMVQDILKRFANVRFSSLNTKLQNGSSNGGP